MFLGPTQDAKLYHFMQGQLWIMFSVMGRGADDAYGGAMVGQCRLGKFVTDIPLVLLLVLMCHLR